MRSLRRRTKAYLLAVTAVLFWSTAGSAFKITLRYLHPSEMLLYILPVALVVQALCLTYRRLWSHLFRGGPALLLRSLCVGLINPFLYYNVLFRGYDLLLTQEATTLNFLWPVVLVLLSALVLKQRVTVKTVAALFLGFAGVCVIATEGHVFSLRFRNLQGVLLVLASTVIWSAFWILNMTDRRDPSVKLFLNFLSGFLASFATYLIALPRRPVPVEGLLGCAWAGVFEMGITFFLWLRALELAERTAQVANLIFLTPFCALVCISLAVGEPILLSTVVGLVLIVAGIACQRWAEADQKAA